MRRREVGDNNTVKQRISTLFDGAIVLKVLFFRLETITPSNKVEIHCLTVLVS